MTRSDEQILAEVCQSMEQQRALAGEGKCIRCGQPAPALCYQCDRCLWHDADIVLTGTRTRRAQKWLPSARSPASCSTWLSYRSSCL